MSYTTKDYEFLGKQVAEGKFVTRTTFFLSIALALVLGVMVGYFACGSGSSGGFASGEQQQPLGQNSQSISPNMMSGERVAAILEHEQQAQKDPTDASNWEHLGNLYYDNNEPLKAIKAYEKHLALNPQNLSVLVDCGVMYREVKNYDKALELFTKALGIDPKHEVALFNTGVVLYNDLDKKEEGKAIWQKLLSINPGAKAPSGALVSDILKTL